MNTGLSYDLSVWLHFGGRVLIRLQIGGILHLYKVRYIWYILNYSCTSGTASENGCALSDSCKADNLTSFPLKKGALRPWVFRSSFNEVSLKLSRYTG